VLVPPAIVAAVNIATMLSCFLAIAARTPDEVLVLWPSHHSRVDIHLPWCYNRVTVVSQWCYP
jgi:hypothetical protein